MISYHTMPLSHSRVFTLHMQSLDLFNKTLRDLVLPMDSDSVSFENKSLLTDWKFHRFVNLVSIGWKIPGIWAHKFWYESVSLVRFWCWKLMENFFFLLYVFGFVSRSYRVSVVFSSSNWPISILHQCASIRKVSMQRHEKNTLPCFCERYGDLLVHGRR